VLDLVAKQK